MNDSENQGIEDEISLVDLFVVLLKRRKIIIGATGAAILLGAVYTIAYPLYQKAKIEAERTTAAAENKILLETVITFTPSTVVQGFAGSGLVDAYTMQVVSDPRKLLSALREAGIEEINGLRFTDGMLEEESIYFIRSYFVEYKTLTGTTIPEKDRTFAVRRSSGTVQFVMRYEEPAKAAVFLNALYREAEKNLRGKIDQIAGKEVEDYERLLSIGAESKLAQEAVAARFSTYSAAQKYLSGKEPPLYLLAEPYSFKPLITSSVVRKNAFTQSIVAIFAVFFLSVLIAFVLESVDTIKADPEAMEKIRRALGTGKKNR